MVHPVQSVIESLQAASRCPRLHVNAMFDGVVCPDFIRDQWRERLIIDLDPSYPLDLTFLDEVLSADLSFGGYVTRCTFPYGAIYVVADRSTGRGIVLDQNMPESVKRSRYGKGDEAQRPTLRTVGGSDDPSGPASEPDATRSTDEPATDIEATDDSQVKKRRAAFKVIDGGG
ncbi:MAG: ClpXP protease specificity-enhancing factor SspB [Myxococcota bacterium]